MNWVLCWLHYQLISRNATLKEIVAVTELERFTNILSIALSVFMKIKSNCPHAYGIH